MTRCSITYAVAARYPDPERGVVEPTWEEAERAISLAEQLKSAVEVDLERLGSAVDEVRHLRLGG